MGAKGNVTFAFHSAPSTWEPKPDRELYREVIEECAFGHELGYEAAWFLEHHFSDYYPTPSPLVMMSHIAAHCPTLGLGVAVLVLPWYHPLRFAEEISMVNSLTEGTLHLGLGRGTAKSEYDAYNVDMNEARARFKETWEIVDLALKGEPFTYAGEYLKLEREIRLRPTPTEKKVQFYGAIGSPASGKIMGELGLPPLCLAQFPDHLLEKVLAAWREARTERDQPVDGIFPIQVKCYVADTDEEARELGRKYLSRNFVVQAEHYEVDANPWKDIPEYHAFSKMFANLKAMADPDNLGPLMDLNFVGSPDTIAKRVEVLYELGFNYFILATALPGTPIEVRREMYERFARDVAPRFDPSFGKTQAAAAE